MVIPDRERTKRETNAVIKEVAINFVQQGNCVECLSVNAVVLFVIVQQQQMHI